MMFKMPSGKTSAVQRLSRHESSIIDNGTSQAHRSTPQYAGALSLYIPAFSRRRTRRVLATGQGHSDTPAPRIILV